MAGPVEASGNALYAETFFSAVYYIYSPICFSLILFLLIDKIQSHCYLFWEAIGGGGDQKAAVAVHPALGDYPRLRPQ